MTGAGTVEERVGSWFEDAAGLPAFRYEGRVPFRASLPDGTAAKIPEDPWFLLGNPQITLFCHVSGTYELLTGQRAWGRMNLPEAGEAPNEAVLELRREGEDPRRVMLTGPGSPAAAGERCVRSFGCGFAQYDYGLDGAAVRRNLSVRPSRTPGGGTSAFLVTVTLRCTGDRPAEVRYTESVLARYGMLQDLLTPPDLRPVRYLSEPFFPEDGKSVCMRFSARTEDPLLCPDPDVPSRVEGFPPSLVLRAPEGGAVLSAEDGILSASVSAILAPGEAKAFRFVVGFFFGDAPCGLPAAPAPLPGDVPASVFASEWAALLPALEDETDPALRREMRWDAYVLEAMATWSAYYEETKIPQGTAYDYLFGSHASARDNCQHALPLCTYDPALARSVLRYLMKRTTPDGEILLTETGYACAQNGVFSPSDQQLYFFLLLTEYLRATGDLRFLQETVAPHPFRGQAPIPVWSFCVRCFTFLRDAVGKGEHGLVRLLNADWNDAVYYVAKVPYNGVVLSGESHMNSAMALAVFADLIPILRRAAGEPGGTAEEIARLADSMSLWRESLLEAFLRDLGDRTFPRRMYFAGKAWGEDNMFLEPQGYALQIPELPEDRRRALYGEMRRRVYPGEALGAREQESPEMGGDGQERGSRENGGFWWALNGPVILGVASFDLPEAKRLLSRMTLAHAAEAFPDWWTVYWSAADNLESSLMPGFGLADQSWVWPEAPVFCAHPHAWPLYCYARLREAERAGKER